VAAWKTPAGYCSLATRFVNERGLNTHENRTLPGSGEMKTTNRHARVFLNYKVVSSMDD